MKVQNMVFYFTTRNVQKYFLPCCFFAHKVFQYGNCGNVV